MVLIAWVIPSLCYGKPVTIFTVRREQLSYPHGLIVPSDFTVAKHLQGNASLDSKNKYFNFDVFKMQTRPLEDWICYWKHWNVWSLCLGDFLPYVIIFFNFAIVVTMVLLDSKWLCSDSKRGRGTRMLKEALSEHSMISWCYHLALFVDHHLEWINLNC